MLVACLCACEENPPDTVISQFERPQDVALVCYNEVIGEGTTHDAPSYDNGVIGSVCHGYEILQID